MPLVAGADSLSGPLLPKIAAMAERDWALRLRLAGAVLPRV